MFSLADYIMGLLVTLDMILVDHRLGAPDRQRPRWPDPI